MLDASMLKQLQQLASVLANVEATTPLDEWRAVSESAEALTQSFAKAGEAEAKELAQILASIASTLSKGIIATPGAGVKSIKNIIGVLRGLESTGIVESRRKQALAEANLFFRDAKKEEARVSEATNFEDDDEQREMVMAIEARIDELEADLLALSPPVRDSDEVRSIFRQFHTLKGEGAICGIKSVADFCHGIETEIEEARSGNLILTDEIVSVLQELTPIIRQILDGQSREDIGEDLIKALMEELHEATGAAKKSGGTTEAAPEEEDTGPKEDKFQDFFSAFAPPPEEEKPAEDDAPADEPAAEQGDNADKVSASDFLDALFGDSEDGAAAGTAETAEFADGIAAELAAAPAAEGEPAAEPATPPTPEPVAETVPAPEPAPAPVPAPAPAPAATPAPAPVAAAAPAPAPAPAPAAPAVKATPPLPRALTPPAPQAAAAPAEAAPPKTRKLSPNDTVIESGDLLEARSAPPEPKKKAASGAASPSEPQEKKTEENKVKAISVDVARLDDLLEIVGEVSLLGSYITTHSAGMEQLQLQTTNLIRACSRLQEVANSMRMTSIRPLFMTVRRAAVDAARASRKMVDINMVGIDTQVDRSIVESLSAALIHIIRNAVDHGIESADVRRKAGKPERGSIHISATRTNADIVIELGDDGKGFDLKSIHDKAVAMGKIAPDATLTNEEVADLVFLPGLSTAKKITGLSGRGVGMEIVRESIDSLRGRVEIKTGDGKGSTVRMRFPLMVAAMDAMMVRVGKNILAMPVAQVRECFRPTKADIGTIEGRGTIVTIRGVILPVLFLGREFGIEAEAKEAEDGVLVVVETGEMLAAVLVDETLGSSQVVIRSLEGPLADSTLVAGAAVLPDGRIGLVIETTKLTEKVATTASKAFNDAGKRQAESSRQIDTVSIGSNQVGIIDFNILAPGPNGSARTHVFAINAFKTREFVPLAPLRSIPNSPPGFAGMMMLRNQTVPVVHMGVVLGLMNEQQRQKEWEQIVLICEFSGKTVGFLVSSVERVSYISWEDIMPPPSTGGLIQIEYVVGTILMERLKGTLTGSKAKEKEKALPGPSAESVSSDPAEVAKAAKAASQAEMDAEEAQVAFVLDFERIVGNVLLLYGDMGTELGNMGGEHKQAVKILLVEDSPLIRKQTNKALSKAGITVLEAGDGQEAWEKITALREEADAAGESIFTRVDLILSDIEMPRMDGYTLTYSIKHDPVLRVLPVLLHSSITNDSMISRATEVEADGFVPKCDPKELADQLRKYL